LNDQNPTLTPQQRKLFARRIKTYWLANNRRVDIKLGTTGRESHHYFPYSSPDARELAAEGRHGARPTAKKQAPAKK
jgi:hypothetical protein